MLSRQDYGDYLKQMQDLELEMVSVYKECAAAAPDEYVKNVCVGIMEQEREHVKLVSELAKLFEVSA